MILLNYKFIFSCVGCGLGRKASEFGGVYVGLVGFGSGYVGFMFGDVGFGIGYVGSGSVLLCLVVVVLVVVKFVLITKLVFLFNYSGLSFCFDCSVLVSGYVGFGFDYVRVDFSSAVIFDLMFFLFLCYLWFLLYWIKL